MFQSKFVVTLLFVLWLQALGGLGLQAADRPSYPEGQTGPELSLASPAPSHGWGHAGGSTAELVADLFEAIELGAKPGTPQPASGVHSVTPRWLVDGPWLDVPHRPPRAV